MGKYAVVSLISFLFAITGLVFMCLIYFDVIESDIILWASMALIILSAILSIFRWAKTRKKKDKN